MLHGLIQSAGIHFEALKNFNTNRNHCVKRKHLMWALALAVERHGTD